MGLFCGLGIIAFMTGIIIGFMGRNGYKKTYERLCGYRRYGSVSLLFYLSGGVLFYSYYADYSTRITLL